MDKIPMLKREVLDESITFRVPRELKKEFSTLRMSGVDGPEILRQFLKSKLPEIKKKLGA
jgi:hypothetical protein